VWARYCVVFAFVVVDLVHARGFGVYASLFVEYDSVITPGRFEELV
jgi:hypothetical protein